MGREGMVRGLPSMEHVENVCDGCLVGKQRRAPFSQAATYRATKPLDLLHDDLSGPITPATPGDKRYIMLVVDDMSRYMWAVLLANKFDAEDAFRKLCAGVENEAGRKTKAFRTDRRGEFTSNSFLEFCSERGIKRHLTAPYSPQRNGVVERRNQPVLAMARSMMKAKAVHARLWGEAVMTVVFLLNRVPTRSLVGRTLYEVWHGEKPAMHFLRVFGCVAHVKITKTNAGKLDDRSTKMVMVRY
jgi:transposase InsO family protein